MEGEAGLHHAWLSATSATLTPWQPLVVEEFGKAKAAAKVYTGEFPHGIVPGGQPLSLCVITLHESFTDAMQLSDKPGWLCIRQI